jgi:uncharacterized membrane protein
MWYPEGRGTREAAVDRINGKNVLHLIGLIGASLPALCSARVPGFFPLGDLPGGHFYSEAGDISSDGAIVVGASDIEGNELFTEAYRWSREGGLMGLGTELSVRGTIGYAISGDGKVIAGIIADEFPNSSVFLWTESGGMRRLLGGVLDSVGGLSSDGHVLVGRMLAPQYRAFRWTEETGAIDLGHLRTGANGSSYATDVSADGSIVVGNSQADAGGFFGFRWTEEHASLQ